MFRLAIAAAVLAPLLAAADWPLFLGNPERNAVSPTPLEPPLETAWTYEAPGVSLDQVVAPKIGAETRFESLQITCGKPPADARISFTEEGIALPMIGRPSVLYGALFGAGGDKARLDSLLAGNRSILDGVRGEARGSSRWSAPAPSGRT